MTVHITIGGTDYGPHGENVVKEISLTKGSGSRNGQATISLIFDYAFAYDISSRMEVQAYDLVGGTANGIFGGFVASVDSRSLKGTVKRVVTIKCVDYNVLWDAINLRLASPLTISADTLPNQLVSLFHGFQWQGFGSVSKDINTTDYRTNITGATVLPALVIPGGQTFRQGMRALMANVQVSNSALRPRYSLTLESDGVGGVQAALMLVDGAATPTPIAEFAETPTGGQRSIYDLKRTLDSSMPLVNARQSRWHTTFGDQFASYANPTSGAAYTNNYVNNGLAGGTGYWSDVPYDDKDSQNGTDAVNKLTQLVEATEYPRETTSLTYDKLPAETLFIRVGQAVTVTWPPDQLVAAPYTVTGLSIAFPSSSKESYERVTLTLGLPRLELGEDGTDGLAGPPHEIIWTPLPPTGLAVDTSYGTNGYTWQSESVATGGFVWVAPAGRQPIYYRLLLHEVSPGVHDIIVTVPGDRLRAQAHNMVVGGVYTPSVVAIFGGGQESEPDTIGNITVPAFVPLPPTALVIDTAWTFGNNGYLYVDGGRQAYLRLAYTPPSPAPHHYVLQTFWDGSEVVETIVSGTYTGVTTPLLNVGDTYTFKLWSETSYGVRSATSADYGPLLIPGPGSENITNPSFEAVNAGVVGGIRGWTKTEINGGTVAQDTDEHTGTYSAKLATSGILGSTARLATTDLVAVRGTVEVLKYWAKRGAAGVVKWTVQCYDASGAPLGAVIQGARTVTTAWTDKPYAEVIPLVAGAAYKKIWFEPNALSQTVYVDDVSMKPQVGASDYEAGSVSAGALATGAVTAGKIATGGVSASNQLAAGVIDHTALGTGIVDGTNLASTVDYTGIMSLNATSEANALKGRITDTQNNAAARAAYLQHRLSSGTPTIGMGSAIEFDANSTTTQDQPMAMIAADWTDPTHATRNSELRLQTNIQGSGSMIDRMRLSSTKIVMNGPSVVTQIAALSTTATDGFLYIPTCAGPPTGVPTAQTGTVPMVFDSTNSQLYVRVAGVWKKVALA